MASNAVSLLKAAASKPFTTTRLLYRASSDWLRGGGTSELNVLRYMYERNIVDKVRGNPAALAAAIDHYADTVFPLMIIGPEKRDHIIDLMSKSAPGPKVFIELGAYVGYSAVALAAALRDQNKGHTVRYISLEYNPLNAAITASFAELAGLKDVIDVQVGPAAESLERLVREGSLKKGEADFVLVDHWQSVYLQDLKVLEKLSLLKRGSVVVADNVLFPGAPDYLEYVTKGKAEESSEGFTYDTRTEEFPTPFGPRDRLAISTVS